MHSEYTFLGRLQKVQSGFRVPKWPVHSCTWPGGRKEGMLYFLAEMLRCRGVLLHWVFLHKWGGGKSSNFPSIRFCSQGSITSSFHLMSTHSVHLWKDLHAPSRAMLTATFQGRQVDKWKVRLKRPRNWQSKLVNVESRVRPSVAWFQNLNLNHYALLSQVIIIKQQITVVASSANIYWGYLLCAKHWGKCWNKSG